MRWSTGSPGWQASSSSNDPDPEDEMVRRLLSRKREGAHPDLHAQGVRVSAEVSLRDRRLRSSFRRVRARSTTLRRSDEASVVPPSVRATRRPVGIRSGSTRVLPPEGESRIPRHQGSVSPRYRGVRGGPCLRAAPCRGGPRGARRSRLHEGGGSPARDRALVLRIHGDRAVADSARSGSRVDDGFPRGRIVRRGDRLPTVVARSLVPQRVGCVAGCRTPLVRLHCSARSRRRSSSGRECAVGDSGRVGRLRRVRPQLTHER